MTWPPPMPTPPFAPIPAPPTTPNTSVEDRFSLGALVHATVGGIRGVIGAVWVIVIVAWVAFGGVALWAVRQLWDHSFLVALREAITRAPDFADTAEIETYFEDALSGTDLAGLLKLAAIVVPVLVALYIVVVAFTTAAVAIAADETLNGTRSSRWTVARRAIRRTPALVVVYLAVYVAPSAVLVGLVVALAVMGAPGAATVAVAVIGAVGVVYALVRSALVGVCVATSTAFVTPVRTAIRIVHGRWWALLWRLVLIGLAGAAIGVIVQIGGGVLGAIGIGGAFVLAITVRVISTLLGTTISVVAQLAMVRALQADRGTAGAINDPQPSVVQPPTE